jgi:endogenous inhibitor of DNA gyrase (YacG/DUF329 family)
MRFQMIRKCPHCGSASVRRSGRRESEASEYPFHSPYRCRDCEQRFWVVSRRTLFSAGAGVAILALCLILWSGFAFRFDGPSLPPAPSASADVHNPLVRPSTDARVLGDTLLQQWGPRLGVATPTQQ